LFEQQLDLVVADIQGLVARRAVEVGAESGECGDSPPAQRLCVARIGPVAPGLIEVVTSSDATTDDHAGKPRHRQAAASEPRRSAQRVRR